MASLHVLRGYVPGLRITLDRPETTLGRGTDCDVPIPITCVSRRHARISRRGDQFILWDLGSRNGTYLNHVLVRSLCPLRNGDHIRLADFEATFESAGALRQESDWQNSLDPHLMMGWLQGSATVSRRRLWLFVAACRRQFGGPGQWSAAELAERYAEEADRQEIFVAELGSNFGLATVVAWEAVSEAVDAPLNRSVALQQHDLFRGGPDETLLAEFDATTAAVCHLLRDVFFNPLKPRPAIDPTWLRWNDCTVSRLAGAIYEGRRFEDMPILHDALLDAGCDDPDVLDHCRGPGPHVRGCWVLDLLLGREGMVLH